MNEIVQTPTVKAAKKSAREARTWAGRALTFLDDRAGPVDYDSAWRAAERAIHELEDVRWHCEQLGQFDRFGSLESRDIGPS
jgi:hypothetical protein